MKISKKSEKNNNSINQIAAVRKLLVYFFCGVFARLRENIVENVEAFTWLMVERQ